MKDLYLMRHGETLFNQRRKIQVWCDSPLTEKGIGGSGYVVSKDKAVLDQYFSE